ncbi:DUF6493 family protein [Embleya sp. NPDC020630]|uniref:DUF6493 family protein n=1 Tax=Embleya sp. NPDC020630 TaxID=3363979 RepID=UPI0037B43122
MTGTTSTGTPASDAPPTGAGPTGGESVREPLTWERVLAVVDDPGRHQDDPAPIVALFAGRTEAERRALLPAYKEAVRSRRTGGIGLRPLRHVGVALLGGPAGIAQWLLREDMAWPEKFGQEAVYTILAERDPAWIPDIATRMAARLPLDPWGNQWHVVDALVRGAGLPTPTTPGFVLRWMTEVAGRWRGSGRPLAEHLAADRYFPDLLPALFEVAGVGQNLDTPTTGPNAVRPGWDTALAALADAKTIQRDVLLDGCLSRLLRGERPGALRGFVRLHEALAPADDELAARVEGYLRLLPDAPSTVAALAQAALRRVDGADLLDPERIAEASRSVLFRAEKTLVRAQLTWLGTAIKRHPEHAGTLLATACTAFGSPAGDLQERAVALIAKHVRSLPPDQVDLVLTEVRDALPMLGDAIRPEAAALIGESGTPEPAFVVPLGPPPPRELPPPISSMAELVEELAVFFGSTPNPWVSPRGQATDPLAVERIVAALLREHARDGEALHTALLPLTEQHGHIVHQQWFAHQVRGAVGVMVAAATGHGGRQGWFRSLFGKGDAAEHDLIPGDKRDIERIAPPQRFLLARLYEVGTRLQVPHSGPYLAEIADAAGFVDPEALVAGLETWEASGHSPWRRDVDQALLRLPSHLDPAPIARAGRLTSPAGRRVARVMAAGGPTPGLIGRGRFDRIHRAYSAPKGGWVHSDGPLATVAPGDPDTVPETAWALYGLADPGAAARTSAWSEDSGPDLHCWPLLLPRDRDVIAAHLAICTQRGIDAPSRGAEVLPALAESFGPLGPGMSLALAYALGAQAAEDRTGAVDAFVTLSARDDAWDTEALGRDLGEAVRTRGLKTTRVVASLRDAARAGATGSVWGTLSGFVPDLLAGTGTTGLGDVLALAAETAAGSGARGVSIPGLAELAERKGSSRAVVEARRLRKVLDGDTG